MPDILEPPPLTRPDIGHKTDQKEQLNNGWSLIVWNDPINLMDYVTLVLMRVLGMNRQTAEKHMMEIHKQGKSVVARDSLEKVEFYAHQLHHYKLQATIEKND